MSIDLSTLSAKELFELAQKKALEEQEEAEHQAKITELMGKRETIISEHKNILLLTDKKIRDMQAQREKLITDHAQSVAVFDKEIEALGGTTPRAETKPVAVSSGQDDTAKLKSIIRQVMNKRDYISTSMLKEKLAAYGVRPANFTKDLEQWVRDGWLENKGKGNFALGKRL
jgi:hypothetical protein